MSKLKLKLGEVNLLNQELAVLSSYALPITTRFWIAKLVEQLEDAQSRVDGFYKESFEKNCDKDENGAPIVYVMEDGKVKRDERGNPFFTENGVKSVVEVQPLLEEEIEVDYKVIKLKDIGDLKVKEVFRLVYKLMEA